MDVAHLMAAAVLVLHEEATERIVDIAAAQAGSLMLVVGPEGGIAPDELAVPLDKPLTELGLDSLMAVRIRNGARADFGVEPPVALILQGASLHDLTADLMRQLGLNDPDPALNNADTIRDRARQRAAARHGAAMRRRPKPEVQGG